jgi:hypothetical protein
MPVMEIQWAINQILAEVSLVKQVA